MKHKKISAALLAGGLLILSVTGNAHQSINISEASNRVNAKLALLELKTNSQFSWSALDQTSMPPELPYFHLMTKGGNLPLDKQAGIATGDYRQKLRDFLTVHFTDHVQIGLDSFKVEPIGVKKSEILQVGALQPKGSGTRSARGYGLELTVFLD